MEVEQLPDQVREFAVYLRDLLARLDQDSGWCGIFWQRDPDGMRVCLTGAEVPPWDVVEALLQDLGVGGGPARPRSRPSRYGPGSCTAPRSPPSTRGPAAVTCSVTGST